ncbi:deoxycytidylate deaminase (dCMP deaminase) [Ceratobasidium sp. AG-Ba]|nr:deoxycytidylate deaminase (dCMP deaminase) [Ceratobasidium sp. AG-Ba]
MQSSKSQHYLNQCIQAAEKSTMSFTLGAVLVKGGKVIAHGHNHQRTNYDGSCKQPGRKPISMHAEMHTISNATGLTPSFKSQLQPYFEEKQGELPYPTLTRGNSNKRNKRTNGTDIYVVRVASGTTPVGSARPCARCLFWCYWAGIRRVFYWDASAGGFVSVKPLEVDIMAYVTQADRKIADGSFEFI